MEELMEIEEMPVVIGIPRSAVKVDIKAQIFMDGKIQEAEKHLTLMDIQDLREDFKRFVGDDWNALYVLANQEEDE